MLFPFPSKQLISVNAYSMACHRALKMLWFRSEGELKHVKVPCCCCSRYWKSVQAWFQSAWAWFPKGFRSQCRKALSPLPRFCSWEFAPSEIQALLLLFWIRNCLERFDTASAPWSKPDSPHAGWEKTFPRRGNLARRNMWVPCAYLWRSEGRCSLGARL